MLGGLRAGVVVVDRDFTIRSWSTAAEDMWGLRADEVRGKNILSLDIGLPVERLREPIRACMTGAPGAEAVLEAIAGSERLSS